MLVQSLCEDLPCQLQSCLAALRWAKVPTAMPQHKLTRIKMCLSRSRTIHQSPQRTVDALHAAGGKGCWRESWMDRKVSEDDE